MSNTDELDEIHCGIWNELESATAQPDSPARFLALATCDEGADARTVVLREAFPARRELICYSDVRARKVEHIRRDGRVALLAYDAARLVQLRIYAAAHVHTSGALVEAQWPRVDRLGIVNYLSDAAPGEVIERPEVCSPFDWGEEVFEAIRLKAKARFCVLAFAIRRIDWLQLGLAGHRRARFDYGDAASVASNWLSP